MRASERRLTGTPVYFTLSAFLEREEQFFHPIGSHLESHRPPYHVLQVLLFGIFVQNVFLPFMISFYTPHSVAGEVHVTRSTLSFYN